MSEQSLSGAEGLHDSWRTLVFICWKREEAGCHISAGMPQEQNYRSELPHHTLTRLYMLFEKDSVQC